LSAVLAAAALARSGTAAAPGPLVSTTVTAATLSAARGTLAAGAVSANVAALVKGANGMMTFTKSQAAVLLLLTAGVCGTGFGVAAQRLAPAPADDPPAKAAAPAEPAAKFGAGWTRTVEATKEAEGGKTSVAARWKLAVEQGWLVVRRETPAGDLEWQVVLTRAADGPPPQARVDSFGAVEVKYGGYFVREIQGSLRVLRERKTAESPPWPDPPLAPNGESLGWGGGTARVAGQKVGDWCWAVGGPEKRGDVVIRLQHKDLADKGYGFSSVGNQLARMFYGDKTVQDDGELLVADRAPVEEVEHALLVRKIRKEIGTKSAPALDAKAWLNAPAELRLDKLRGQVVLLDFWGAWCGPCVAKLPRTEELHQKYKDRGLVVIGVHSANESEKAADVLKEKAITFAVAIDRGSTAEHYAVEAWPTYFLIDKSGKVVWGFAHEPPKESQIEELLR
jgi:thiol-disulfide isomerase/thioredoxin